MVLGNPHFPWDGPERFFQAQLTIPGKVDVAGASLFGVPVVLIGSTRNLAWSHTVSTAFRFTPFEVKLVPGAPTTYLVDGQPHRMERDVVTVDVGGGQQRTRTLYSTKYGPVFTSLLGLPLFPWTSASAYSMGDVNGGNFRYLNHFFETNQAQSVEQYDTIERRYRGFPGSTRSPRIPAAGPTTRTSARSPTSPTTRHASAVRRWAWRPSRPFAYRSSTARGPRATGTTIPTRRSAASSDRAASRRSSVTTT